MYSKFYFDKISFFDVGGIFLKRWIVSTDLVDWDGSREGKSFENGFFIIDFGKFFVDETITPEAKFEDFASDSNLLDEFG